MNIDQAIKDMKQSINKEVSPNEVEAKDTPGKAGRPKVIDKVMEAKLIRLAEEYFFIRSIAGKAGISHKTIERYISDPGNIDFVSSFTQARDKWITDKQTKLETYASDKKTADWRAMQYLLTIADKEYSERKYLTDAVSNQDAKILLMIKAEQLTIASQAGNKMLESVIDTPLQSNKISLLPFNANKVAKASNKGKKKKASKPKK